MINQRNLIDEELSNTFGQEEYFNSEVQRQLADNIERVLDGPSEDEMEADREERIVRLILVKTGNNAEAIRIAEKIVDTLDLH